MTEIVSVIMQCIIVSSGEGSCKPYPQWGTFQSAEECYARLDMAFRRGVVANIGRPAEIQNKFVCGKKPVSTWQPVER